MLFVGLVDSLQFDVGRWRWKDASYSYHALQKKVPSSSPSKHPMVEEWAGILPRTYNPNWKDVWL
jgi:hypothetical protein